MATAFDLDTFRPAPTTKAPVVRIAFQQGRAAQAAHSALAQLPPADRSSTLDELALREKTEQLIATAKQLLSPPMYSAFLAWGEATSHFMTLWEEDEVGNAACERHSRAVDAVIALAPANEHDWSFRVYLTCLTAADGTEFGPLDEINSHYGAGLDVHLEGLKKDFAARSPLPGLIGEVGRIGGELSDCKLNQFNTDVGPIITAAFAAARGEEAAVTDLHRAMLERRNAIHLWLNDDESRSEEPIYDQQMNEIGLLDHWLMSTEPKTIDGLLAQLTLGVQTAAEGMALDTDVATQMIRSARRIAGLGTLVEAAA